MYARILDDYNTLPTKKGPDKIGRPEQLSLPCQVKHTNLPNRQ